MIQCSLSILKINLQYTFLVFLYDRESLEDLRIIMDKREEPEVEEEVSGQAPELCMYIAQSELPCVIFLRV